MTIQKLVLDGLHLILSWNTLLVLVLGVLLGMVAGALPGFTSGNTCAIALPLTIGMSTLNALVFMGAIYTGSQCGGGIPAILFNVPGTPQAASTALDGFKMTRKGKPDLALGACIGASAIGGVVSAIIAILATNPMAQFALKFGPAEMFVLALMGVAVLTSLVGDDLKKGLLTAALGFLVASVCADPYYGLPRCTFGFLELYDEVPLIATLIGLFAIPSLLQLANMDYIVDVPLEEAKNIGKVSKILKGFLETIKRPLKVLKGALIGAVIGAIPGTGANIATFVSYGSAVALSKHPETFGEGEIEGVIACESANNGCVGGAMIPAFALGVPGSGTTAIMLSALLLHGIVPGPYVVRNYGGTVYGFLLVLLIASLCCIPLGILFSKFFAKLTVVRSYIIVPVIGLLCVIGSFSERQLVFDMYLLLIFGLLGVLLQANKYPLIPFIFGIVLGNLTEKTFLQAISISLGDPMIFFKSSICKILWAIIILVIAAPKLIRWLGNRKRKAAAGKA